MLSLLLAGLLSTCPPPWSAIDIAHTLERQGVGKAWRSVDGVPCAGCLTAVSKPAMAVVVTFGCEGDYLDEVALEESSEEKGIHAVRFRNDAARTIVAFYRPVTVHEAAVTRLTLANLTP